MDALCSTRPVTRRTLLAALAAGAMLLAIHASSASAEGLHEPWTETGRFVSAPDGDTLRVQTASRGLVNVRLAGVDTPEHGQAWWRVARKHLVDQVAEAPVKISCYKVDQYKREICRVTTRSGDLGASMLAAGLGWHYKRFADEQPPEERALYAGLEDRARESRTGLWSQDDPMPPDECRRAKRAGGHCR